MSVLRGRYFDGRQALSHAVNVVLDGARLRLVGPDIQAEFDARSIRVSPRIAQTPRWLYLPDGGTCMLTDSEFLDRLERRRGYTRVLHKLESRPAYAAIAVALVVSVLWLILDRGVPLAVEHIVQYVPVETEKALGAETLAGMERYVLRPSKLPAARQAALREQFYEMVQAGGGRSDYRIQFRSSPVVGPNAFALPSGIIVMTDELVKLAKSDREIVGVLAHELGHVHHRHAMRSLLEGSLTALVIAGVTGDVASATSLAAAAPAVLLQNKYSRDSEREADRYAVELMKRSGIDPRYYAALLKRMEANAPKGGAIPAFLSSHPASEEREALAVQAAGAGALELEYDTAGRAEAKPEPPKLMVIDPEQKALLALLERRSFDELDRVLGGYQFEFEHHADASGRVLTAFWSFGKAPARLEPVLNEWAERKPTSYAALAARGHYYVARGLDARGTETSANTGADSMDEIRRYFRLASADLERSIPLAKKPFVSHRALLTIGRTVGSRSAQRRHYDAAIRLAPGNVGTREFYMGTLEPRWGGSYAQMEAFLAESRAAVKDPKDLGRLAARIPAYRGVEKRRAEDYPGALAHFNEAVRLHASADTLCERSYVLSKLHRNEEALRDVSLALSKDRQERYCLRRAAFLARYASADEAIRLTTLVLESDPASIQALNQRGWRYAKAGKRELAFQDYLASATLGDGWAQLQVGKLYASGHGVTRSREEALVWLRKAAAQGQPDAKLSLQQALNENAKAQH